MTQRTTALPETGVCGPNRGDAIDSWLAMFTRFLRLPSDQSRAIRDELDSHIRERVRDLMLAGLNEDEGVRRAIDELGEAAELAAHFRAVHRPNRRLLMSIAAIGVAAGAAVISVVALTQSQPPAESRPPVAAVSSNSLLAGEAKVVDGVPMLKDLPLLGTMFVSRPAAGDDNPLTGSARTGDKHFSLSLSNTTLRKAAEAIGQENGKRVSLQACGTIDPDQRVESLQLIDVDLASAVRQLNGALGLTGENRLDVRFRGEVMDVAPIREFDKAETTLVAYDLGDVMRCAAKSDDLIETLTQFVEPDGWRENGGETARLKVVGTKMFVEAPPRYHERVAWILDQFSQKKGGHPAAAGASTGNAGLLATTSPFGGSTNVLAKGSAAAGAPAAPAPSGSPFGSSRAPAASGSGRSLPGGAGVTSSPFGSTGLPGGGGASAAPAVAPVESDPVSKP